MEELQQTPLFYEQFFAYVSREDALFNNEVIRTSDLNGEQLWLLDEGHCFRDQLVRFCQMKSARASQLAYVLLPHGRIPFGFHQLAVATGRCPERAGTFLRHPLPHPPGRAADQ